MVSIYDIKIKAGGNFLIAFCLALNFCFLRAHKLWSFVKS
jgi:hypothetical protein